MKLLSLLALSIFMSSSFAGNPKFSIIKTGQAHSLEGMIYSGGSMFKKMTVNHAAFLIEYKNKKVLFETGLGKEIDQQFSEDMPFWARPLFAYEKGISVKEQILDIKIDQIVLSHAHWDHASGLADFPGVVTLMGQEEKEELDDVVANRTFPSQFRDAQIEYFDWKEEKYLGFEKYYDLFGDKKVLLVPLNGHSHGSIGLIINSDKKYFLVGDAIWTNKQLKNSEHKFYLSSLLVDGDRHEVMDSLKTIKKMQDKGYLIIPTHDYSIQEKLGYFPIRHN